MFFPSIHRTLNHILLVDQVILEFVSSGARPKSQANEILYEDFEDLLVARQEFDEQLIKLASSTDADWLSGICAFPSNRHEGLVNIPRAYFIMQMFNHQTHHRSQITSELHKMGIDYGTTDMPLNPYIAY